MDAAADAPADVAVDTAAAWTPAMLGGLVLWLDAGKGITAASGAKLDTWMDQSGQGNHARQTSAASMPTFTASALRALPAVTFDGQLTFLSVTDATSMEWGVADYTVLAVARCSNAATETNRMLYQKTAAASPFTGVNLILSPSFQTATGSLGVQDDATHYIQSTAGGYNDNMPRIYGGRRVGTTLQARVNGTVVGQVSESPTINVDAPGRAGIIGHNGYQLTAGFQALKGDVFEIVAIKGTISDADLAKLESYLRSKYGL
jgi:hypothetical protein